MANCPYFLLNRNLEFANELVSVLILLRLLSALLFAGPLTKDLHNLNHLADGQLVSPPKKRDLSWHQRVLASKKEAQMCGWMSECLTLL